MAYVNVSETSEFTANVKRPQDLIDGVTSASLLASVQPLTNRSKWLYDLVVGGVLRVRSAANIAEMQALTSVSNMDLCAVLSSPSLYFYNAYATNADGLGPLGYDATGMGDGVWISTSFTGAGQSLGLATLDANARVVQVDRSGLMWVDVFSTSGTVSGAVSTIGGEKTVTKPMVEATDRAIVSGTVRMTTATSTLNRSDQSLVLQYAINGGSWSSCWVDSAIPETNLTSVNGSDIIVPVFFVLGLINCTSLSFRWRGSRLINDFTTSSTLSVTCFRS